MDSLWPVHRSVETLFPDFKLHIYPPYFYRFVPGYCFSDTSAQFCLLYSALVPPFAFPTFLLPHTPWLLWTNEFLILEQTSKYRDRDQEWAHRN